MHLKGSRLIPRILLRSQKQLKITSTLKLDMCECSSKHLPIGRSVFKPQPLPQLMKAKGIIVDTNCTLLGRACHGVMLPLLVNVTLSTIKSDQWHKCRIIKTRQYKTSSILHKSKISDSGINSSLSQALERVLHSH